MDYHRIAPSREGRFPQQAATRLTMASGTPAAPPPEDQHPISEMESLTEARSEQTIVSVQKELAKLGYYHGQIDGIVGPETRKAISWFQSVDKLSVSGRIDDPTLKALQIS
jgi:His-Xaa-Ser repeat protein HxsA